MCVREKELTDKEDDVTDKEDDDAFLERESARERERGRKPATKKATLFCQGAG